MKTGSFLPRLILAVSGLIGPALPGSPVVTEADTTSAQAMVQLHGGAVINVELVVVLKLALADRERPPREQRVEINGTVVAPTGLTAIPLSAVEPRPLLMAMRDQTDGRPDAGESSVKSVKLRFADGVERSAKIVAKDAGLGLAFVIPVAVADQPPREYDFIDLKNDVAGTVFANYIVMGRAPVALQGVALVRLSQVTGVVPEPVRRYLLAEQFAGVPVFDVAGRVLGIATQLMVNGRSYGTAVLPAGAVARAAALAREAP